MNQKGFTLVEILAAVTILGILTTMAIAGYTRYIDYAKQKSYKVMAKSASTAAEDYIMDNPGAAVATKTVNTASGKKYVIKNNNAPYITFDSLIEEGYLNGAQDPDSKGNDCKGKVTIGLVEGLTEGALDQYIYVVDECCMNNKVRYTYTIEIDNETGESKSIEEVNRNVSESTVCP